MSLILRTLVSKKKRRYIDKKYNLDLTYVTDNIIAMGFPCENYEKLFRNPLTKVKEFLEERHKDKYKLWNLCAERKQLYRYSEFHDRVDDDYAFYDHEAPPYEILLPFCQSVHQWLGKDKENIAVIHCKAGKGRTGVMIAAYLVYSKNYKTAEGALAYYAKKRTKNAKGVTIPSQIRYVKYVHKVLQNSGKSVHPGQKLVLQGLKISLPKIGDSISFEIQNHKFSAIFNLVEYQGFKKTDAAINLKSKNVVILEGDCKFCFKYKDKKKKKKLFHFWLNMEFIDTMNLVLKKKDLDRARKDKENKKFPKDFQVEISFAKTSEDDKNHVRSSSISRSGKHTSTRISKGERISLGKSDCNTEDYSDHSIDGESLIRSASEGHMDELLKIENK